MNAFLNKTIILDSKVWQWDLEKITFRENHIFIRNLHVGWINVFKKYKYYNEKIFHAFHHVTQKKQNTNLSGR